jgi:integrase
MRFLNVETYEDLLRYDSTKLTGLIRDFIIHMKEDKKSSPATISVRVAAITHFYEMNDVTLHWSRLNKFKGRFRNVVEDQPYTKDQIKKLVKAAPLRDQCIITLMACSGMRRGAIPLLRLKDIDRIEKHGLLKFRVYKNEQESYITYCTPECTALIDQYLRWRERLGEKFTPNTPLFRQTFDTITQINQPKPMRPKGVSGRINKLPGRV